MFVEDPDSPYQQQHPPSQQPMPFQQPPPSILAGGVVPSQIVVEGFPQGAQEFVLKLYLANICPTNQCTEVKTYGSVAVATFSAPVGRESYYYTSISLITWIMSWDPPDCLSERSTLC